MKLFGVKASPLSTDEKKNSKQEITEYNNFYEFGTDKDRSGAARAHAGDAAVDGRGRGRGEEAEVFDIDDLLKLAPLEERVYRMRCVEGWSMVIPWVGYSLSELIKQVEPTGNAKYVEFVTLADPKQMPGVRSRVLDWPYVEGLRIDEAMHPLTLLCVGLYGETLPNQSGAPVRVVVPWKYGFKSGKSIVKIRFVEKQPRTAWNKSAPREYGFYSNVNPDVDHPRWSQATERRIGEFSKRKTTLFNGYADQVALALCRHGPQEDPSERTALRRGLSIRRRSALRRRIKAVLFASGAAARSRASSLRAPFTGRRSASTRSSSSPARRGRGRCRSC